MPGDFQGGDAVRRYGLLLVGTVGSLSGCAAGTPSMDKKQMSVTAFEDATFVPLDSTQPDFAQIAVLWGDPTKGPSDMLLRFKKTAGGFHYHTSDYHLVLLQGTMKHYAEGQQESDSKDYGPGSHWFQPGNQVHSDACLTEECLMFIHWADARDAKLPEELKR
jgi:hypothetical protein